MSESVQSRARFDESDARTDEMHSTIEQWAEDLVDLVDDASASEQFQRWLDVQSRFHDYSYRNTLLITLQCPEATKVAGYRTWQDEFDRQVQTGEDAIWIWAPIIARQCPACGNSPNYHDDSGCGYDETPPEEWSEGPVAFKPVPVFDVSQTEGEPLPDLETAATGEADELLSALRDAATSLDVAVSIIATDAWDHGSAAGVCRPSDDQTEGVPRIEIKERTETAAVAGALIHEYAHALLHVDGGDHTDQSKRELEAEAVAYIVGRYFGLDTDGSALYLAAWADDDIEVLFDRLDRISRTATTIIDAAEATVPE